LFFRYTQPQFLGVDFRPVPPRLATLLLERFCNPTVTDCFNFCLCFFSSFSAHRSQLPLCSGNWFCVFSPLFPPPVSSPQFHSPFFIFLSFSHGLPFPPTTSCVLRIISDQPSQMVSSSVIGFSNDCLFFKLFFFFWRPLPGFSFF